MKFKKQTSKGEIQMKNRNNKYVLYLILFVIILGIVYTACKDITPKQERVEQNIELKLSK